MLSFLKRALRLSEQGQEVAYLAPSNLTSFVQDDEVVFVGYLPRCSPDTVDSVNGAGNEVEGERCQARQRFREVARRYKDRYSFGIFDTEEREEIQGRVECYNVLDDVKREVAAEELEKRGGWQKFVQGCTERVIPELTRRNEIGYYQVCLVSVSMWGRATGDGC
jgi:hypothetical protein